MRNLVRRILAPSLARAGVRLVSTDWGPRGFATSFLNAARQGFSPHLVIDAGAAHGTWTLECLGVFPNASYLMIDPLPANATALQSVCDSNRNVRYWQGALGGEAGRMPIFEHGDQSSFHASGGFSGASRMVEVDTLDGLLPRLGLASGPERSTLLKIDVQGFELEVLKGAEATLANTGLLLIEVSTQRVYDGGALAHDVISHLGSRGFGIFDVSSYVTRPLDDQLCQMDLILAPIEGALMNRKGWHRQS